MNIWKFFTIALLILISIVIVYFGLNFVSAFLGMSFKILGLVLLVIVAWATYLYFKFRKKQT